MKDKLFLRWIHDRLEHVHKDNPMMDFMGKLRSIINATDPEQETANTMPAPVEVVGDALIQTVEAICANHNVRIVGLLFTHDVFGDRMLRVNPHFNDLTHRFESLSAALKGVEGVDVAYDSSKNAFCFREQRK